MVVDTGAGLGAGVGAAVGAGVGAGVGVAVGIGVGASVTAGVGSGVGTDVGTTVGLGVGDGVGTAKVTAFVPLLDPWYWMVLPLPNAQTMDVLPPNAIVFTPLSKGLVNITIVLPPSCRTPTSDSWEVAARFSLMPLPSNEKEVIK